MSQQRVLFASVFVFAALAAGVLWKERFKSNGALTTASLGLPENQLPPMPAPPPEVYGPEPLAEGMSLPQPKRVWRPKTDSKVAAAGPASLAAPVATTATYREPIQATNVSLGFDAGADYFVPTLRWQYAVDENWVIGLHAAYLQNIFSGPRAEVLGGGADLAFFWDGHPYRGGFVDVGLAAYQMTTTTTFRRSFATPAAVSATVGWSGSVGDSFILSLSAGGQWVYNFRRLIGDVTFDGLKPLARATLGIRF